MKVVTAAEMREIDRATIEAFGIPGLVLMERAGLSVAAQVRELAPGKGIICLCGTGNNGGDGLVAARILHNEGFPVRAMILSEGRALSPDCGTQYRIACAMGVPVEFREQISDPEILSAGLIVDAVFGTGLTRPVSAGLSRIFEQVNSSPAPVISVDIPSGISSDTGKVMGAAIEAQKTVTFGLPKRGHLLWPGAEYRGRLFVKDIGFPRSLLTSESLSLAMAEPGTLSVAIRKRQKHSHKGDYGHILIVAGSPGKTGAALMAARACLRAGAGLVTLGVPQSLIETFQNRVLEEMIIPRPDDDKGMISREALEDILGFCNSRADILAIGPGLGVSEDTGELLKGLITESWIPLVIDADGLNAIENPALLSGARAPVILTPHPGEMARLMQKTEDRAQSTEEIREGIEKERIGTARAFSEKTGAYLVLKGVPTITSGPSGKAVINTSGNPGMATAGSGDVLTGVISGLLGQGLSPMEAAVTGVWLHGHAGDLAAAEKGEQSLIASDIIAFLPKSIASLMKAGDDFDTPKGLVIP
ncbi:MAG: NAD(P)H-hydrate dehydratase [Thermodesulfovibrionales bacterium]|jgi:NAD(P)H-hydrate epimerase